MNSDEMSNLIGHNYLNTGAPLHQDHFALQINDEVSYNTNDVAFSEPLSPARLARIQEMNALILQDGSERQDVGPLAAATASSHDSHRGASPGEITSDVPRNIFQITNPTAILPPVSGTTTLIPTATTPTDTLANLQNQVLVHNGVLTLTNYVTGETSNPQPAS